MSRRFVYLVTIVPPFVLSGNPKESVEDADSEGDLFFAHDDDPQRIESEDLVRPN